MTPQTTAEHRAAQAAFARSEAAERQRLIKLCNVARSDRQWTDEEWAHIKRAEGGADSLTDMDVDELDAVLAYAKRCGFVVRHAKAAKAGGANSRPLYMGRQARLIRGVWLTMAGLGIVRNGEESALGSWLANRRDGRVVTDLALLSSDEMDRSINRLRAYFCREIGAGVLFCPECRREFRPSPKQAWAFGRGLIGCDGHTDPVPYQWRKAAQ